MKVRSEVSDMQRISETTFSPVIIPNDQTTTKSTFFR